ncbi:MAG: peptidylprolyl isomerase [Thaumarchaeota archaeon]|nr:MAG: peptidylprolyl isomerase [Nitrososphaerota archaeon]
MPHTFGGKKVREPGARRRKIITRIAAAAIVAIIAGAGLYIYISNRGSTTTQESTSCTTGTLVLGAPKGTYAKINTSLGCIEVQLYPSAAPKTVANFVNLSRTGFYNNLVWHRIVAGFVIQTGDPNTKNGGGNRSLWGTGGSGKTVPLEINSTLHNDYGYLGMARSTDPNSGSSQFYINLANNTSLNGQYTVFGKVISGIDVALAIGKVTVNSTDQPITPVFVTSITIQDTP